MNELSNVLLSGALGIINFWILRELNLIIFFNTKDTDEKRQFIIILGIVNFFAYQLLMEFNFKFLESYNNVGYYIMTFGIAVIVEVIICYIVKKYIEKTNKSKIENGKILKFHINTLDRILEGYENQDLYAYVFDFDNNLIEHGYVRHFSTEEPEFNLSLEKRKGHSKSIDSYKDFIILVDEKEIEILNYIDFVHKIKIYLFTS